MKVGQSFGLVTKSIAKLLFPAGFSRLNVAPSKVCTDQPLDGELPLSVEKVPFSDKVQKYKILVYENGQLTADGNAEWSTAQGPEAKRSIRVQLTAIPIPAAKWEGAVAAIKDMGQYHDIPQAK